MQALKALAQNSYIPLQGGGNNMIYCVFKDGGKGTTRFTFTQE